MSQVSRFLNNRGNQKITPVYVTKYGRMYCGLAERVLTQDPLTRRKGRVQLIFTSPPFPLNTKKKYGNLEGAKYLDWLCSFGPIFREYLSDNGSLVVELGNGWVSGSPEMSTLPLKALLQLKESCDFHLCQEFIYYNPARLPTPAQWVTVERIRVKDSFTRFWWLSPTRNPKADNRRVLREYSPSMKRLLSTKKYNSGHRPSQHLIGRTSFLNDNGGAVPPNVLVDDANAENLLVVANTRNGDSYHDYCTANKLQMHPARMPRELPEFFIRFLTDEGDLVLDPFAGSNTTGAAAERLQRRWIAVEARDDYLEGSRGHFAQFAPESN